MGSSQPRFRHLKVRKVTGSDVTRLRTIGSWLDSFEGVPDVSGRNRHSRVPVTSTGGCLVLEIHLVGTPTARRISGITSRALEGKEQEESRAVASQRRRGASHGSSRAGLAVTKFGLVVTQLCCVDHPSRDQEQASLLAHVNAFRSILQRWPKVGTIMGLAANL
jgi:hypothetical protein